MKEKANKIRYFIYTRKSTESDDRQIQSIEDQIFRLTALAKELDLEIIYTYYESKSAKKPNNRPVFDKMIERIENGDAEGILCWKIDRLSRNPVDSGRIQWMLQQGKLKSIRTIEREYLPDDNVIIFNVETGMANQYILDLRKNIKRGLESKLRKGIFPNLAPLGYLNTKTEGKGENYIKPDPERFELIQRMWKIMVTGNHNPSQILKIANKEWKFKTRKSKRLGGKELSRTAIYKMFTNPFYAGIMRVKGVDYEGVHEAMITVEEFDRVQILLGRKGRPRAKVRHFPFTGCIRCGECGCLITAEIKTKIIKNTKGFKHYEYYHCTRKRKDYECSQRKVIKVADLEKQIEEEIEKIKMISNIRELALEELKKCHAKESHLRSNIYQLQHESLVSHQEQLDTLIEMRLKQQITDEEYTPKRNALVAQIKQLKDRLRETENRAERWLEITERVINFATYAYENFTRGNIEKKKEILLTLGQNFILTNGKLSLERNRLLKHIKNSNPYLKTEYERLELGRRTFKAGSDEEKQVLENINNEIRRGRDSNPR